MKFSYAILILFAFLIHCASSASKENSEGNGSLMETIIEKAQSEEGQKAIKTVKEQATDKENQEKVKSLLNKEKK